MGRKQKNIHYIYKTTCIVTGRYYIGMHSTDNLEDGYLGSGKRLWFSLNYHGKENHIKEILEFLPDREALRKRENEIVTSDLIKENLCMNLAVGGEGGFISLSGCTKGGLIAGKITSERAKVDEVYKTQLKTNYLKMVEDAKSQNKYKDNRFRKESHSEETKKLMSNQRQGNGKGETNSQYGTCWITKGGLNMKVKKETLDYWLIKEGWVKGRKIS